VGSNYLLIGGAQLVKYLIETRVNDGVKVKVQTQDLWLWYQVKSLLISKAEGYKNREI
jgi:hypothetical protein